MQLKHQCPQNNFFRTWTLAAKSFSEARSKAAIDRGMVEGQREEAG